MRAINPGLRPRCGRIKDVQGFTLLELLIGMGMGLVVVSTAMAWAGQALGTLIRQHREWQVHLELRALSLPLQLELRRAGAHGRPSQLVWQPDAAGLPNPFTAMSLTDAGTTLRWSRALDKDVVQPDTATEVAFRWIDGRMDQTIGGRFQPMTDPTLVQVTQFAAEIRPTVSLGDRPCADAVTARIVRIQVQAQPTQEAELTSGASWSVQPRNDQVAGGCP
ncbi:PilW family protein [Roseateles terrae]|uniref:Type II secretory pathway component PulJ n=1 Tax=Roseateles terrae TaxID=431060 RepID=A0ABR6GLQ3_9BURK|nr:hypothetical protein [Roseateles terrae]MBB3192997.1 type II secretory pathway component PulJ [Roseateles terrae]